MAFLPGVSLSAGNGLWVAFTSLTLLSLFGLVFAAERGLGGWLREQQHRTSEVTNVCGVIHPIFSHGFRARVNRW